jgi:N-acetylmuramic acid 6-phosphate etherase
MAVVASGKAPFVLGAMERAKRLGASTGAIVNVSNAAVSEYCDHTIELLVGPEVVAGSSRMKAGTAEKLVLNMISTAVFVRLGGVYGNMMVGLKPLNGKIRERSVRILSAITGSGGKAAEIALADAEWDIRVASLMILRDLGPVEARRRLESAHWNLRKALH